MKPINAFIHVSIKLRATDSANGGTASVLFRFFLGEGENYLRGGGGGAKTYFREDKSIL